MARSAAYQILAKYREILLDSLLVKGSGACKTIDLAKSEAYMHIHYIIPLQNSEPSKPTVHVKCELHGYSVILCRLR